MAKSSAAIQPERAGPVEQEGIEHERRRDAEIDDVGQRIHLRAELRRRLQHARDAAVDAVEEGGDQHHRDRRLEAVLEGQPDAGQAGADRQHGDQVGQHHAQRDFADARAAAAMRFEGLEDDHQPQETRTSGVAGAAAELGDARSRRRPPSGRRRRAASRSPAGTRRRASRSGSGRSARRRRYCRRPRPSRRCGAPPGRRSARRRPCRWGCR